MAHRAEQQAAAGTGPNVLALGRQRQDLTAPAEAVQDVHALMDAAAQYAHAQRDRDGRLHQLEQQLNATGRFGRPALRGDDRTHAEAERETLHQHRAENVRELEGLHERFREQAAGAGLVEEHDAVLTEAEKLKRDEAALLRRAQAKDNQVAKPLRAEAAKSRSTAGVPNTENPGSKRRSRGGPNTVDSKLTKSLQSRSPRSPRLRTAAALQATSHPLTSRQMQPQTRHRCSALRWARRLTCCLRSFFRFCAKRGANRTTSFRSSQCAGLGDEAMSGDDRSLAAAGSLSPAALGRPDRRPCHGRSRADRLVCAK